MGQSNKVLKYKDNGGELFDHEPSNHILLLCMYVCMYVCMYLWHVLLILCGRVGVLHSMVHMQV